MRKILVIFGTNSFEHDVSCESVKSVLKNIDNGKFNVYVAGITKENKWYLYKDDYSLIDKNWLDKKIENIDNVINFCKSFDLVIPIIHGKNGEDGKIQGFFELFNIKYIGCNQLTSTIGYDKYLSKLYCEKLNIPQLPYIMLNNINEYKQLDFEFPVIIKPSKGGSSIGISIANTKKELKESLKNAFKYDNKVVIEKFIKARELECAILEDKKLIISDIGEILKENEFYDFEAKYITKTKTGIANISNDIKIKIKELSKKIFIGMNCKDLSRIDFLYDEENNQIYFNEINTMPGFTDISMYPILLNNKNISFKEILTTIINKH